MIDWSNLGYADAYTDSFATFERMQNEGTIPADVRFQLQYPTPLADWCMSRAGRSLCTKSGAGAPGWTQRAQ
jgi:hypothetical protein